MKLPEISYLAVAIIAIAVSVFGFVIIPVRSDHKEELSQ